MKSFSVLSATAITAVSLIACGGDTPKSASTKEAPAAGAAAVTASAPTTAPHPFKVKSGIVESTVDMMGEQKQTMYFDDYGAKQALVTAIEIMGTKSESITINADGWSITYDPAKKEGTKHKVGAAASASPVPNLETLSDDMKQRYKLKEIDGRTIAGKETKGFAMEAMSMPMKVWLWEGIPMRTEVSMGKQPMISEVKSLQTDVPVPADRFTVPADVKLKEM